MIVYRTTHPMLTSACQSTTKGLCSIPGNTGNEGMKISSQCNRTGAFILINPHTMSSALGLCFKNTRLLGTLTHFTNSYPATKNRLPSTHRLDLEVPASFQFGVWNVINKLLGL